MDPPNEWPCAFLSAPKFRSISGPDFEPRELPFVMRNDEFVMAQPSTHGQVINLHNKTYELLENTQIHLCIRR